MIEDSSLRLEHNSMPLVMQEGYSNSPSHFHYTKDNMVSAKEPNSGNLWVTISFIFGI